ncbi:stage V sporulation protein AB [Orenia metallireducens]|jgi:stage V sporulation protein AB|uniref:Stage V sporulation protein AB n=1 Tax=Orenia metallireducens TaxID=1413210 RepID=A0A285HKZ3_9FIRM|nr:stage V sporulation protein AB [Orenia metallireducens]SNY36273.1 stage V sporulation protein AB [Orenia metallireducens]
MKAILLILIGFSEGVIVGVALVAFLMVLDVIPRLIDLSNSENSIFLYQKLIVLGSIFGVITDFFNLTLPNIFFINKLLVVLIGLIFGIFIGLVAAALTETLKVLPLLSKRLGLKDYMDELLFIIILGKVIGSLIYWLFPRLWFLG